MNAINLTYCFLLLSLIYDKEYNHIKFDIVIIKNITLLSINEETFNLKKYLENIDRIMFCNILMIGLKKI